MATKTVETEVSLLKIAVSSSDQSVAVLNQLCSRFAPMVAKLARDLSWGPESRRELRQEGYVALLAGLKYFDPHAGACLSTFLYHRIRGRMLHWRRDERQALTLAPISHRSNVVSLYEPILGDGNDTLFMADIVEDDTLSARPDDRIHSSVLRDVVAGTLRMISRRQSEALRLLFWDDLQASEIAERLGVSRPRVTVMVQAALSNLQGKLSHAF
ncbi:MAG TPA: sigma-70 family RNA polymerase sigma factor [Acidobacteriota bacterium]|jgi:RNA polymerase sigma factor (sigma-70 family)